MPKKLQSNDPCWCGSRRKYKRCHKEHDDIRATGRVLPGAISAWREVPDEIVRPRYLLDGRDGWADDEDATAEKPTGDDLAAMRRACHLAATVLRDAGKLVQPGTTTDEIDAFVHQAAIDAGAYPSPLGYAGSRKGGRQFPKSVCSSVNEVICHGIPDSRALEDGDICNLDVTVYLDGFHGDTNATFLVGEVDAASRTLVDITRQCMERGIDAIAPGRPVQDIGQAIQDHAHRFGYSVVRSFVGHGVGRRFHCGPTIFHYPEPRAGAVRIEEGMTFTVEPMIAMGTGNHLMWDDHWTAVTADNKRTAQFEHTILVTAGGAEVLTV